MALPDYVVFIVVLSAYIWWSERAGLDSRYPFFMAIGLLVAGVLTEMSRDYAAALVLSEFVFFLIAGGIVTLIIDHLREALGAARLGGPSGKGANLSFDRESDATGTRGDGPSRMRNHD